MKVISFINMKGGVGKSTMAINVAHCLSEREQKKVLIVDMDPQFNATQCLISPERYIEHVKSDLDTICTVFQVDRISARTVSGSLTVAPKALEDIKPISVSNGLDLLPGDLELHRVEVSAGSGLEFKLKRYLETIEDNYDFVIIDTPPTPSIWMSSALIASNYYIIPVKPDPLSITGIDLLDSIIEDKKKNFNLNIKCVGLVFNMVEENTTVYKTTKQFFNNNDYWKKFVFKSFLPKRTDIAKRQTSGIHILKLDNTNLHMSLVRIVDEVQDRIS